MSKPTVLIGGAVVAVLLVLFFLKSMVFGYRYVYEYEFGGLASDLAHFWAGPFTKASFGSSEFHSIRPLPNLYMHLPDTSPIRLNDFTEEMFTNGFGRTYAPRRDGLHHGRAGDAEFGFKGGLLKYMGYFYKVGWPCFSKDADSQRYCFPLSTSQAKELFGEPKDWGRRQAPFI